MQALCRLAFRPALAVRNTRSFSTPAPAAPASASTALPVNDELPAIKIPPTSHKLFTFPTVERRMRPKGHLQQLKLEQRDKMRAKQKRIDPFKAGDHIGVKLYSTSLERNKFRIINGVCLARKNRCLHTGFKIRTVVLEEQIEYHFPLYSPWIHEVRLLKQVNPGKNKLYGMREARNDYFMVENWDGVHEPLGSRNVRSLQKFRAQEQQTGPKIRGLQIDDKGNFVPRTKLQRFQLAQYQETQAAAAAAAAAEANAASSSSSSPSTPSTNP